VHDHFAGADAFVLVTGLAWLCVRRSDRDYAGQRHTRKPSPFRSSPSGARCTTRQMPSGPRHRDDDRGYPHIRRAPAVTDPGTLSTVGPDSSQRASSAPV